MAELKDAICGKAQDFQNSWRCRLSWSEWLNPWNLNRLGNTTYLSRTSPFRSVKSVKKCPIRKVGGILSLRFFRLNSLVARLVLRSVVQRCFHWFNLSICDLTRRYNVRGAGLACDASWSTGGGWLGIPSNFATFNFYQGNGNPKRRESSVWSRNRF